MSDDQQTAPSWRINSRLEAPGGAAKPAYEGSLSPSDEASAANACQLDEAGHCITCSDEAWPARVLSVEQETGLAIAALGETLTEIDVTLVDAVAPGDWVLVHGGTAIASLGEADNGSE